MYRKHDFQSLLYEQRTTCFACKKELGFRRFCSVAKFQISNVDKEVVR